MESVNEGNDDVVFTIDDGNLDNKFLMKEAIRNGFDVNWLLNAEIPEDISTIHKQIRAAGFLKYQKVRYL